MPVGVAGCTAGKAVPAGGALVEVSLLAATTERGGVSGCVSAPSREIGFVAGEVALVFAESFIAGASAETTEIGADAGAYVDAVVGSVGGAEAILPEDALLVPTVTVPGEPEALPSAGEPAEGEDGGIELTVTVPGEPEPLPSAGEPADEDGGGVGLVATGIGLSEESPSPEDEPPVEGEPPGAPGEEGEGGGLSALSSLPPSSDLLAELESSPPTEAAPDEGGMVLVADVLSEASSSPDDDREVEGEALIGAGDEDADVLSPSVELPLVFGLSPESSDPASSDEPRVVEFACAADEGVPEEGLTLVPDTAVAGESFTSSS
jgi:hypothetical protein